MKLLKAEKIAFVIFLILIMSVMLCACASSLDSGDDVEKIAAAAVEEFYSFDKDGRFTELYNNPGQESLDDYYRNMQGYFTSDYLEVLTKARMPQKFELQAVKEDVTVSFSTLTLTKKDDKVFDYEVRLDCASGENSEELTATGQVKLNDEHLITEFKVFGIRDSEGNLWGED